METDNDVLKLPRLQDFVFLRIIISKASEVSGSLNGV